MNILYNNEMMAAQKLHSKAIQLSNFKREMVRCNKESHSEKKDQEKRRERKIKGL